MAACARVATGEVATTDTSRTVSRIAFGSCADQSQPQPIWQSILAVEPELFVMLGDNVYGDVSSSDLRELKDAYARFAAVSGFRKLRASVPVLATWDDHDYGENDGGADFAYREQVETLFENFWSVPADSARARRPGVYDTAIIGPPGRRVQIILLDTRSFRSPLRETDERGAPGKERYLPDPDPAKSLLGDAQWEWLARQLERPAELRLVVSSIQVLADGHGWERWGNLPRERDRLFRLLATKRANGVVFISGDRHVGAIYRRDGILPYPVFEVTSSSLNRPNPRANEPGPHRMGDVYRRENFGTVLIDWASGSFELELRDLHGVVVRKQTLSLVQLMTPPHEGRCNHRTFVCRLPVP